MKLSLNKLIGLTLVSSLMMGGFSSCVKDRNNLAIDYSQAIPVVEMLAYSGQPNGSPRAFVGLSFEATAPVQTVPIYINYAAPNVADRDITVTVALDPSAIAKYNTVNSTNYQLLAANAYSFSPTVTIKKGEQWALLNISINPALINLAVSNALAFKIVDGGGVTIHQLYSSSMLGIVVKNQYDANYTTSGRFFHPTVGRALADVKHLATVSGIRTEAPLADLYGQGYYFQFDVDAGDNLVNWGPVIATPGPAPQPAGSSGFMSADNPGGAPFDASNGPALPGTAPWIHANYPNKYDRPNKTFLMHYGYVATVVGGQNSYTRQCYEKWVRNP